MDPGNGLAFPNPSLLGLSGIRSTANPTLGQLFRCPHLRTPAVRDCANFSDPGGAFNAPCTVTNALEANTAGREALGAVVNYADGRETLAIAPDW